MLDRLRFHFLGTDYVFVAAWAFERSRSAADASLAPASQREAERVLRAMALEPSLLDRLARMLEDDRGLQLCRPRGPLAERGSRFAALHKALGLDMAHATNGLPAPSARLLLLRQRRLGEQMDGDRASVTRLPIERALAQLGDAPLIAHGESYRLAYAGATRQARSRDGYETLAEEQLLSVLRTQQDDATLGASRKAVLAELLALAEAERTKTGRTRLLLLRRWRWVARPATERAPTVTPSQLRQAREQHWIEVLAVDPAERPLAGIALEFELADGSVQLGRTRGDGFARLERIPAGDVKIRLPEFDGNAWRPLGGGAASDSGRQSSAATHVVGMGDCLTRIARKHGFKGWKALWNHQSNDALRARRKSPHVLAPGDVVAIPPRAIREITRASDASHRIEVAQGSARVRFRLQDLAGGALSHLSYEYSYKVGEESVLRAGSKATDGDGWLEEELPLGVAQLIVETHTPRLRFTFPLRHLQPARDLDRERVLDAGVARRLLGLGYATGERRAALFQTLALGRKDAKGELDTETLAALERAYTA